MSAPPPSVGPGLPPGWEQRWEPSQNRWFYIDHIGKRTQWDHPSAAAAVAVAPPPTPSFVAAPLPSSSPSSSWTSPAPPHQLYAPSPSPQQQPYAFQPAVYPQGAPAPSVPVSSFSRPAPSMAAAPPASALAPVGGVGSILGVQQAPLSLVEPSWDQKQTGFGCSRCVKEFTFINRRHRCRCCFREFCGTCTAKNLAVPQFGHTQAVRVCDACHGHLSANRKRCLSRLVPYFERDNVPDSKKQEALAEAYDMLTSGAEILEDAKVVGIFGPLLHVVESAGIEKPNLTVKALSMISLLTDLDNTNCGEVASVPGAIGKLVAVVNNSNPQARILAAEILNALSRNKETVPDLVAAEYVKPIVMVLSGHFADAKLLDVCSETLASLVEHSETARLQLEENPAAIPNLLGSLTNSSLACQRFLVDVLVHIKPASIVKANGAHVLVPLVKTLGHAGLSGIIDSMAEVDGGPAQLLEAGILGQLIPEEKDPLIAVLILLEKGKNTALTHALLPFVSDKPEAGRQLCLSGQMGRLTSILHSHFAEDVKLMVLRVLSSLVTSEDAVRQIVDTGGLYDLVNHVSGSPLSLLTAYLSVLQSMLRFKYCVSKATDAGAIQALVPLTTPPALPVIRQMALSCLETMCSHESEVRVLVVGVASPQTVVAFFLQEAEGLRLVRRLLEDPVTNADLMEAGIFAALLRLLSAGSTMEQRTLAASALALCIQQNTTVDAGYIGAIADLMNSNGAEVGAELLAGFSAQPVYRQFIVQRGLVPSLIGMLLGGSPAAQQHSVLALANIAYEDAGSSAILREGGVSVLLGLINHPVDQVQGCSLLAIGNLARSPACRSVVLRDGGAELILEKFSKDGMSVVAENYCLWALRMLVVERGVPEHLAHMACLKAIFPKLARHISQSSDSKPHALGFCTAMCAMPAFCEALSSFESKQDLLTALLIEPGPGRDWALREVASIPIGVLLLAPNVNDAISALLTSGSVVEQQAGLSLCAQALAAKPDENLAHIPIPLVVRLLPASSKVLALACHTAQGRALLRSHAGSIPALVDAMAKTSNPDAAAAVSMMCRDAENVPMLVKLGVVGHLALSNDPLCLEALGHLCAHPEARSVLVNVPMFLPNHLLPLIAKSNTPNLMSILLAMLKEPSFKSSPGVCTALLASEGPVTGDLLDALCVLPPAQLYAEGAFDKAVSVIMDESASMVLRGKAVDLLKRISLQALDQIVDIPNIVQVLLGFMTNKSALFLLDLVLRRGCAVFISQGGIAVLLKLHGREDLFAPIAQILQKVIVDPAFDKATAPVVIDFCHRVLSSNVTSGVPQFLALQLLKELYHYSPDLVGPVVSSPAVVERVKASPLLLEAIKFFFAGL